MTKRTPFYKSKQVDLTSGLEFFEALTEYYRHRREEAPQTLRDRIMAAPSALAGKVRSRLFAGEGA